MIQSMTVSAVPFELPPLAPVAPWAIRYVTVTTVVIDRAAPAR